MATATRPRAPRTLAGYLEALSRSVFQAGISGKVVDAKWATILDAFHGFDPTWVAALTPEQVLGLSADPRVIRNRRKIEGTVENAQTLLDLNAVHRGFRRYLHSFDDFPALSSDLQRRFRFLGEFGAYHFLWVVGEPVPEHEEWARTHTVRSSSAAGSRTHRGGVPPAGGPRKVNA